MTCAKRIFTSVCKKCFYERTPFLRYLLVSTDNTGAFGSSYIRHLSLNSPRPSDGFRTTLCTKFTNQNLNYLGRQHLSDTTNSRTENYELVYSGILSSRVFRVKLLSIGGSVLGIITLPQVLGPVLESSTTAAAVLIGCSSIFIVGTPLLLHFMCRRYVTELLFDRDRKKFRATVLTLFFRKKHIYFSANEVEIPDVPLLLTSFVVRGFPLLVDAKHFKDIEVYRHMMGYDKPIDFKLGNQNTGKK